MSDTEPGLQIQTPVTAIPWILLHPYIAVGPVGSEVEFHCAATNLAVEVTQDEKTAETFCGVYPSFKAAKWIITATSAMSYGAAGLWNLLQPLMGTQQPFEVRPDTAVASPANPSMKGTCVVKWVDFINAAPGEISECDVVLAVLGAPTFATT
jgi:hypothetical protein